MNEVEAATVNTVRSNVLQFLYIALGLFITTFSAMSTAAVEQNYRLAEGDRILIRVYGEDDMTVDTRLGDTGIISYPFLGDIQVRGLTVAELTQRIVRGLKGPYLVDPSVSVDIVEYRPFFLNGEVNKPGAIPYQPGMTLRKAIAMAGGFTERANRKNAEIISAAGDGQKVGSVSLDDIVHPGDIITVKQSFF